MTKNEQDFQKNLDDFLNSEFPDFTKKVCMAVVGKVSAGKSSLINALLQRDRSDQVCAVGAVSGVTTNVKYIPFDDDVFIVDCPGLDDVKKENSDVTQEFLNNIDIGIFVVTGSADESQKENFDLLKQHTKHTLVVLNKFDEFEKLSKVGQEKVIDQWKQVLGVKEIFPTVTEGYDPDYNEELPLNLKGIDDVRDKVIECLKENKKDILFIKTLKDKRKYVAGIAVTAVLSAVAAAQLPAGGAIITGIQAVAIASLAYIYTGEILSKKSALALLPTFAAESLGSTLYVWAASLIPTGIINATAGVVAGGITLAMLGAVIAVFEAGGNLDDKSMLSKIFKEIRKTEISISDLKSFPALSQLLFKILFKSQM
ncbi:GTPase [Acinetobacter entericus]|uniref:50S ribosome-binding GTPase n=1 Tax=Acinetobacter entericus TaxID=2989714 RepID=A0ABT3NJ40_9GAMM|nr:GTPase [Acinetobacter entericus]MCW8039571.1 50S ribosome-binding GTPase [Acinetobacter entericus]